MDSVSSPNWVKPIRGMSAMLVACLLVLVAIWFAASRWADANAIANTDVAAANQARSAAGLLSSELQKFRLLPVVLTEYPDARATLETGNGDAARRMNEKLELLAERTDAAVIYLIGANGRTIAASNSRLPTSFVGQDYGFRPYFKEAMEKGSAELFALGTVSGRPGLFIARRINGRSGAIGVIVVKVEFDQLEAQWARQPGPIFVADDHGVIIITSEPSWRFLTLTPLDAQSRTQIREAVQFGSMSLTPLNLERDGKTAKIGTSSYREIEQAVPMAGGKLHLLQPLASEIARANAVTRSILIGALALLALALGWFYRSREKARAQREMQQVLEREVAARTAELRDTNARLRDESQQKDELDQRYRAAREELAQASRLGSIGQITAGVTHEINQPIAAIRSFAENARTFLGRGQSDMAERNLTTIVDLTERVGAITSQLRNFARRSPPQQQAVQLKDAIDGALLLMGDRIRTAGVKLDRVGDESGVKVVADRVRLEQIIVNLLQNAVEALQSVKNPSIEIQTQRGADGVALTVADNGPGVAPSLVPTLFTPFVTGKKEGLGLGLGIARDIAREFGGQLDLIETEAGGAIFRLQLRHA